MRVRFPAFAHPRAPRRAAGHAGQSLEADGIEHLCVVLRHDRVATCRDLVTIEIGELHIDFE